MERGESGECLEQEVNFFFRQREAKDMLYKVHSMRWKGADVTEVCGLWEGELNGTSGSVIAFIAPGINGVELGHNLLDMDDRRGSLGWWLSLNLNRNDSPGGTGAHQMVRAYHVMC